MILMSWIALTKEQNDGIIFRMIESRGRIKARIESEGSSKDQVQRIESRGSFTRSSGSTKYYLTWSHKDIVVVLKYLFSQKFIRSIESNPFHLASYFPLSNKYHARNLGLECFFSFYSLEMTSTRILRDNAKYIS